VRDMQTSPQSARGGQFDHRVSRTFCTSARSPTAPRTNRCAPPWPPMGVDYAQGFAIDRAAAIRTAYLGSLGGAHDPDNQDLTAHRMAMWCVRCAGRHR
jgi:hypothetical protein